MHTSVQLGPEMCSQKQIWHSSVCACPSSQRATAWFSCTGQSCKPCAHAKLAACRRVLLTRMPAALVTPCCFYCCCLQLNDVVLEAVVSCSHKTLHYALLLGEHNENQSQMPSMHHLFANCLVSRVS
jgi:hypothetical protein